MLTDDGGTARGCGGHGQESGRRGHTWASVHAVGLQGVYLHTAMVTQRAASRVRSGRGVRRTVAGNGMECVCASQCEVHLRIHKSNSPSWCVYLVSKHPSWYTQSPLTRCTQPGKERIIPRFHAYFRSTCPTKSRCAFARSLSSGKSPHQKTGALYPTQETPDGWLHSPRRLRRAPPSRRVHIEHTLAHHIHATCAPQRRLTSAHTRPALSQNHVVQGQG